MLAEELAMMLLQYRKAEVLAAKGVDLEPVCAILFNPDNNAIELKTFKPIKISSCSSIG